MPSARGALIVVGTWVALAAGCDEGLSPVRGEAGRLLDAGATLDLVLRADVPSSAADAAPPVADSAPSKVDKGPQCQSLEKLYQGRCYRLITSAGMTRAAARQRCTQYGAKLASIHSLGENSFVYGLLPANSKGVWIGLQRQGSGFTWDDGTPLDYTRWDQGEPNDEGGIEDCGVLWGPGLVYPDKRGKWNDAPCSTPPRDWVLCKR